MIDPKDGDTVSDGHGHSRTVRGRFSQPYKDQRLVRDPAGKLVVYTRNNDPYEMGYCHTIGIGSWIRWAMTKAASHIYR